MQALFLTFVCCCESGTYIEGLPGIERGALAPWLVAVWYVVVALLASIGLISTVDKSGVAMFSRLAGFGPLASNT